MVEGERIELSAEAHETSVLTITPPLYVCTASSRLVQRCVLVPTSSLALVTTSLGLIECLKRVTYFYTLKRLLSVAVSAGSYVNQAIPE